MPRKCSICTHPERGEIERRVASGESYRNVAQHFGVSIYSLHRHVTAHMPPEVLAAQEAQAVERGATALEQVRALNREARDLLEEAKRKERYSAAVQAIGAALRALELEARLLGELDNGPKVRVQVDVVAIRKTILRALEDAPPELRMKVADALLDLGRHTA
jgi:hypothetical protein